jgi:hypothetical protein
LSAVDPDPLRQVAAFGGVRIALDQRYDPIRAACEEHALETVEKLAEELNLERWGPAARGAVREPRGGDEVEVV